MRATTLYDAISYGGAQRKRIVKLDTPLGSDWLLPMYVKGHARLGRDYEFVIDAISTRGKEIKLKALIGKAVTLWILQSDGTYLPHHGYVHTFSRLGADGYLTIYRLEFTSWMNFLRLRRDMRDWQEQSGEQIVADVFNQHPQARGAYRFQLRRPMPRYSYRVQWEYDWNFVHRSLEEAGVFGRFEQAEDGKSHTLVLLDDLYDLPQLAQQTIRFHRTGLREEVDGFTQWKERQRIQSASLTTSTFDYKRPDLPMRTGGPISLNKDTPADGEVYDYTGAYTWGERVQGDHQATVRLDAWESETQRFEAVGSVRNAMPGYWFLLKNHPLHDAGSEQDRQFAILATTWVIQNNLPGMDDVADFPRSLRAEIAAHAKANAGGVRVKHADGSEGFFQVEIEAQRRRLPFRSPLEHRKPVMQLQTAIVAGLRGEEVFTDPLNRVKVWFPWNRRNDRDDKASCWVRAAFPDAGDTRGGHFPLRAGDEVLVGFAGGDCDRPVIIGRMHGGTTPPIWHTNGLLSGFRSKEYGGRGFNQLVLDDSTGQNRIHLYSTSADSHLHLGYLIDQTNNTRGAYLGTGFDLKSSGYGAIRASQGLYVTTHTKAANSQPLEVNETQQQLIDAESVVEGLSEISEQHQAESLKDAHDTLRAFTDATRQSVPGNASGGRTAGGGTGNANGFEQPIMLLGAPAAIGLSSRQSVHVAATHHVNVVSGQSAHLAVGKSLLASIGQKLSLFVQNAGMKLFAAKGKVEVQAQSDNVELTAHKSVKLLSTTENVEVAADQAVLLASGGAYIRLAGGNIEIHAPGKVDVKGAQHIFDGPASMGYPLPAARPDQPGQLELLHKYANGAPVKGGAFSVFDSAGQLLRQGALDANGHTVVGGLPAGAAMVRFGDDPRQQDQMPSRFKLPSWPQQPEAQEAEAADAAGAAQAKAQGFLPAGESAGAGSAGSPFASIAAQLAQGSGGLMQAAGTFASQALGNALPSGAAGVLAKASQFGTAAKQIGSVAQDTRAVATIPRSF